VKLQAERFEGSNAISRHGPDGVIVDNVAWTASVLVPWKGLVEAWPVATFSELTAEHFARIARIGDLTGERAPELVIFGSGPRIRFPAPALLRPLIDKRIGVETMDTAAACRTYNVLLGEGRAVVAALLFEAAAPTP